MKKSVLVLVLLYICTFCFCRNKNDFSLSPHSGACIGQLQEYLYSGDELVSLLEWPEMPLFYAGFCACVRFNLLSFYLDFDCSLPFSFGKMHDYDWEGGLLYSHTAHPLKKSQRYVLAFGTSYEFLISEKVIVFPELQLNCFYNSFEADSGRGIRRNREIKVYGIDYLRHSLYLMAGTGIRFELPHDFYIKTDILISPFTFQYCYDYHKGVKHPFSTYEYQTGFFSKYKIGLSAGLKINEYFSLNLFSAVLFGFPDKGKIYSDYYSEQIELISDQRGGSGIFEAKFGVSADFKLFH